MPRSPKPKPQKLTEQELCDLEDNVKAIKAEPSQTVDPSFLL